MLLFIAVVITALVFEYSNGFHDAANAIATVVSTKVLTPRQAIIMATVFNLIGALLGGAVASTVGKGLVDTNVVTLGSVLCALIAAFGWNILTWWVGLPSSSSHALIGGLCGAALATAHGNSSVLKWNAGLWPKVVLPMFTSPIAGFIVGAILMFVLFVALHRFTPYMVHSIFGKLQLLSAAWMAHSHGTNDAQKTMGIITLALFTGTKAGSFDNVTPLFHFLRTPTFGAIPVWVKVICAIMMAVGTAAGGWRIIRTLGHRVVKLQPVHGFAAETTAALIIQGASFYGIPLSTTHVISTSIMGVGAVKRFSGVKWLTVERIIWAWIFTLPATGLIGYVLARAIGAH
ncbi:MAG TPA: inorganic phosphate transporter [Chthoniobacterales bacterium]|jgi:PiT family inorganic phosphate transporter|nr:inorganic phosphate transporter [Chthoniobacterales bacterium]